MKRDAVTTEVCPQGQTLSVCLAEVSQPTKALLDRGCRTVFGAEWVRPAEFVEERKDWRIVQVAVIRFSPVGDRGELHMTENRQELGQEL